MNASLPFDSAQLWQLAGWTMVHFIWLGAAAAIIALLCRVLLCKASPNLRYATALSCLVLLAAMPIAIATWLAAQNSIASNVENPPWQSAFKEETASADQSAAITRVVEPKVVELNPNATPETAAADMAIDRVPAAAPITTEPSPAPTLTAREKSLAILQQCIPYLPWLWLIGTPTTFALLAFGLVGTKRLRQASRTIDDSSIAELLKRACTALNVRARVGLAVCDRIATPVLIGILRPMILLPPAALTGWSPDEIEMVLVHELAHVRRWDNLVNLVQRCLESLLFFHPAVWIISTWVRREREDCCDAIVVGRTQRPHAYAELLVALAAQMPRSVLFHPVASSAMATGPLRSRIRRILQLDDDPMLISGKSFAIMLASILAAATFTVLYVPTIGQADESATSSIEIDGVKLASLEREIADNPDKFANAHLPYAVEFEQGANRFLEGDNISILEVRGTSRTFERGNVYQIKGKYTLGSHDRARLCAFTTAKKAADGTGPVWEIQATYVDRGEGTFTLFLPMKHEGWPHISFYPAGKAASTFGGIYFGTGDSVLKKWWKDGDVIDKTSSTDTAERTGRSVIKRLPAEIATGELISIIDSLIDSGETKGKRLVTALPPKTGVSQFELGRAMSDRLKVGNIAGASTAWIAGDQIELIIEPDSLSIVPNKLSDPLAVLNDKEAVKALFRSSDENPSLLIKYHVPSALHRNLNANLEGWKNDPFGPQIDFDAKWDNENNSVLIRAPSAAHEKLFSDLFRQASVLFDDDLASGSVQLNGVASIDLADPKPTTDDSQESPGKGRDWEGKPIGPGSKFDWSGSRIESGNATDDWLKETHFASAEDRDVAKRAWKELGIKFVPANDEELAHIRDGSMKGGLKALDLEDALNVKPPVIFTHFQSRALSTGIPDFATLNKAIDALVSGRDGEIVVLNGINKGGGVIQYSIRWPLTSDDSNAPHPKFPSLEDQKLADFIWKQLRLEMEPIGDDDLKRVKALGYDGGLRVIGGIAGLGGGGFGGNEYKIQTHDILVGLHVWPTTSMKAVVDVLNRGDLGELNPLKFYVVRRTRANGDHKEPLLDTVVTGRISVQLDRNAGPQAQMEAMQQQVNNRTQSIPREMYFYSQKEPGDSGDSADNPPFVLPSAEDEDTRPKSRTNRRRSDSTPDSDKRPESPHSLPAAAASTSKESLRYDDKTFDQWRSLWKNELSNTKRSEAIKALAAFARAGYRDEAIDVILEVASEYDFRYLSSKREGPVQHAVLDELAPESGDDSIAKYWVPDLAARLKSDPHKWKWLAYWLLGRLRTDDPGVVAILRSLAAEGSSDIRSAAVTALLESNKWQHQGQLVLDDETRQLMADALTSNDNQILWASLRHLVRNEVPSEAGGQLKMVLLFQPELVPVLFHEDEHVQRQARSVIQYITDDDASKVIEQLVAELNGDAQNPARRVAAIRALAAIGNKAQAAIPELQNLVTPATDKKTLIALLFALQRIAEKPDELPLVFDLMTQNVNNDQKEAMRQKVERDNISKSLAKEAEAVLQPNQHLGGGGGFF